MPTSSGLLIADSGPLIALAKLALLDLPAQIYATVSVPETVFRECVREAELPDAKAIELAVSNGALSVVADADWPSQVPLPRLDSGELAAIATAIAMHAQLLIDELRGRHIATQLGIEVIGVCGLLLEAKRLGLIHALAPKLDFLQVSGYYISTALRHAVLSAAGE